MITKLIIEDTKNTLMSIMHYPEETKLHFTEVFIYQKLKLTTSSKDSSTLKRYILMRSFCFLFLGRGEVRSSGQLFKFHIYMHFNIFLISNKTLNIIYKLITLMDLPSHSQAPTFHREKIPKEQE